MARSYVEIMGLQYEAERLVRSGESRAEVARLLGVHPQTLAGWALKYGWRKKDLDIERSAAITRRTITMVKQASETRAAVAAQMVEREALMRTAIALIAEGTQAADAKLARLMARVAEPVLLEGPKVEELAPDAIARQLPLGGARLPEDGEIVEEEEWARRPVNPDDR